MHFIRCILPNSEKHYDKFNEEVVLNQLKTSCTIAYANFIRFGYAKSIPLKKLTDKCETVEKKLVKTGLGRLSFYSNVLLSIGLKIEDFKIGNETIFFRFNKFDLVEQFFVDMETKSICTSTSMHR